MNKLIKSKYSFNAPIRAFFDPISTPSLAVYIFLIFCVSYAVRPTKTKNPITDIANYRAELPTNKLTILAIIIPIKPINKKPPNFVRSLFVV